MIRSLRLAVIRRSIQRIFGNLCLRTRQAQGNIRVFNGTGNGAGGMDMAGNRGAEIKTLLKL